MLTTNQIDMLGKGSFYLSKATGYFTSKAAQLESDHEQGKNLLKVPSSKSVRLDFFWAHVHPIRTSRWHCTWHTICLMLGPLGAYILESCSILYSTNCSTFINCLRDGLSSLALRSIWFWSFWAPQRSSQLCVSAVNELRPRSLKPQ